MTEREVAEAITHLEAALVERGFAYARARRDGEQVVVSAGWPIKLVDWGEAATVGFAASRPAPEVRETTFPFVFTRPLADLTDVAALADALRGDPATTPYDALYPEPR